MWVRRVLAAALAVIVTGSVVVAGAGVASAATRTTNLAPGLTYRRITDPKGPWIIHVLTIDPTRAVTVDPVMAGLAGSWARTSTMGSRTGALAAVNGDFSVWPGAPMHPFVEDGRLQILNDPPGYSFGVRANETDAFLGRSPVEAWAKNVASGSGLGVASWNHAAPNTNQVVGFTGYGNGKYKPPTNACSVRLIPEGPSRWGKGQDGVVREYSVKARACQSAAMSLTTGSTVLSSKLTGVGASWIKNLKIGGTVRLSWRNGMKGVLDVISSAPIVLENGVVVGPGASCTDYLCRRHPRTAVGVSATNKVFLVVVDGRKSTSVGMRLDELGRFMKSLGAVDAMNLDGGGSATMWVKGKGVVNDPTDSDGERAVSTAIVVLPGPDSAESTPKPARAVSFGARTAAGEKLVAFEEYGRRSAELAASDPASSGGLIDWMLSSGAASRTSLPPALLRTVDRFRASR